MCGRSTYKLTWEEIALLYRLTSDQPPQNTRARYNVCPTTTIDTIVGQDGSRRLAPMRWGLVPGWWSKSLKDLRLATFNARAEPRIVSNKLTACKIGTKRDEVQYR
jgi:putative SOS response-associated peptidase YedK